MADKDSKNEVKMVTGECLNPFGTIIAMKDIKDKTTRKGTLRALFDCIDSLNSAVDNLQTFIESSPENGENDVVKKCLGGLTSMQIQLLELCQQRIKKQNVIDPAQVAEDRRPVSLPEGILG